MLNITHDIRYIPIFDISIQFKLYRYCITGLMYHGMAIYRYIFASLLWACVASYIVNASVSNMAALCLYHIQVFTCHKIFVNFTSYFESVKLFIFVNTVVAAGCSKQQFNKRCMNL